MFIFGKKKPKTEESPLVLGQVYACLESTPAGEDLWRVKAHPNGEPNNMTVVVIQGYPWPFFVPMHWDADKRRLSTVSAP